ncbi:MAG: phosphotransferase [Piscinibacter sp.]
MTDRLELGDLLDQAAPPVTLAEAAALAERHFGLTGTLRPLTGERDRNFHLEGADGRHHVVKIAHPAEAPAVTDFQVRALLHIAEADPTLATPRAVLPVDGAAEAVWRVPGAPDRRLRCYTYLEGRPLHLAAPSAAQRARLGRFLARLDTALAGFRHPSDDHDILWDLKRAARVRPLLADIADPDRRALPERAFARFEAEILPVLGTLRTQVVHNDFNPHNILADAADDSRIAGVIDFGDMVRAPLVQDLATACAYQVAPQGHPLDGPADLIAAFHAELPLEEAELAVLPGLIATRMALTIAISSWRAARHPDNAAYILRNQKAAWSGLERLERLEPAEARSCLAARFARGAR